MCIRDRYIWAQLTDWVNPSHRTQGMVGMSKGFTLWSLVCTYERNLPPKLNPSHRPQGMVGMSKVFTLWSLVCTYERNLPPKLNPSHRPKGMVGMSKVFTLWSLVCTFERNLLPKWTRVSIHRAWLEWAKVSHHDHQRVHEHNLQSEWIRVTVHRAWLEWARFLHHDYQRVHMSITHKLIETESPSTGHGWNEQGFHIMIIDQCEHFDIIIIGVYLWAQLTIWVNPSYSSQGMVGLSKVFMIISIILHEYNLHPEWIQATVHRVWLE